MKQTGSCRGNLFVAFIAFVVCIMLLHSITPYTCQYAIYMLDYMSEPTVGMLAEQTVPPRHK